MKRFYQFYFTGLFLAIIVLTSCKKETNELYGGNRANSKEYVSVTNQKLNTEGPGSQLTGIYFSNGAYHAEIGSSTLTFSYITYRTNAFNGEAVISFDVSSTFGSVTNVGPSVICYFSGLTGSSYTSDLINYQIAMHVYDSTINDTTKASNRLAAWPKVGDYIYPTYGSPTIYVFRGVVIRSSDYASGFAIAPASYVPVPPPYFNESSDIVSLKSIITSYGTYYLRGPNFASGTISQVQVWNPVTYQLEDVYAFVGTFSWDENRVNLTGTVRIWTDANNYFDYSGPFED